MQLHDAKSALVRYFNVGHQAMLWKIDGLSDFDARRPLTATGTNVLGIMKHVAWVELGYFGDVFDRPPDIEMLDNAEDPHIDMYASADESRADIVDLFNLAWSHAQATIDELDLETQGHVPWWGDAGNPVTLAQIMVHMTTELYRHLGQVDILRESVDGAVGMREGAENMPEDHDPNYWADYCARLQAIAEDTRG